MPLDEESVEAEIDNVLQEADRVLDFMNSRVDFIEIRWVRTDGIFSTVVDGETIRVKSAMDSGMGVRVCKAGAWGFSATNSLSSLRKTATNALSVARCKQRLAGKDHPPLEVLLTTPANSLSPNEMSGQSEQDLVRERIAQISDVTSYLKKETSCVKAQIVYSCVKDRVFLLNSYWQRFDQTLHETCGFSTYVRERGNMTSASDIIGYGDSEARETLLKSEAIAETGNRIFASAQDFSNAKQLKKDEKSTNVIFDQKISGVLAHEFLGHLCEIDSIPETEAIRDLKNSILAKELNVIDDPTVEGGYGFYKVDNEGIVGKSKFLVKNGIFMAQMNSLETMNAPYLTGNARAESYYCSPIPRMSTSYVAAGKNSIDEVFDIARGLYLKGCAKAEIDLLGKTLLLRPKQAFYVKNGEIATPLRNISVRLCLHDMAKIDAIANDVEFYPSFCLKLAQLVPVGLGAPHLRLSNISVRREQK